MAEVIYEGNIDWALLKEQKQTLVRLANNEDNRLTWGEVKHLDGITAFIDSFQDQAEEQGQPVEWLEEDNGEDSPQ